MTLFIDSRFIVIELDVKCSVNFSKEVSILLLFFF